MIYFEKFIHKADFKGLDMANETLRHSYVAYVYLCVYMDNQGRKAVPMCYNTQQKRSKKFKDDIINENVYLGVCLDGEAL